MSIILIGMPGSGKTTLGKLVAKELDFAFYDSDKEIESKTKKTVLEIFSEMGEGYFRDLETETLSSLALLDNAVISTGGGVVERLENIDILKKSGTVIFINRPLDDIIQNINVSHRPLLKDGKDRLKELYARRINLYKDACNIEIINNKGIRETVKKITDEVKKNG